VRALSLAEIQGLFDEFGLIGRKEVFYQVQFELEHLLKGSFRIPAMPTRYGTCFSSPWPATDSASMRGASEDRSSSLIPSLCFVDKRRETRRVSMLNSLAPNLWAIERPLKAPGLRTGHRMTVARLANGDLWVHSPVAFDEPSPGRSPNSVRFAISTRPAAFMTSTGRTGSIVILTQRSGASKG
jgi:hypothetical protein